MKKKIILLLFLTYIKATKAQTYITIPDANFVTWLQTNIPSAMSGNQMDITHMAVTTRTIVDVQIKGIANLTGIEYFTSLKFLQCRSNQLTSLPNLPSTITDLDCEYNQLTVLPALPPLLEELNCSFNQLSALPILPNSITALICADNQLTNLPLIPSALTYLNCRINSLTTLPPLPSSLNILFCNDNQLNSLPILPLGLTVLYCHNNNISCFPVFPPIPFSYLTPSTPFSNFNILPNPITCLPNYIPAMDDTMRNYPLCISSNTLINPNGCQTGTGITGTVFDDQNLNCIKNTGETGIKNGIVKLYDNANMFIGLTNIQNSGLYFFNKPIGNYRVVLDTVNKPYHVLCSNPGIDSLVSLTVSNTIEDSVNFAVTCDPGFDVGIQSVYSAGAAFPGATHILTVEAGDMSQLNNLACISGVAGTVSFSVNGPVTFVGPAPGALAPNVVGNVYTYTIANFATVHNNNDFRLLFTTNSTAQAGEMICVNATVTPFAGDKNIYNNTYQYCYPVVNSYDPNIKEVYPVEVSPNYNDWLTYTIHFQNTGNAPAMNIRLEDELDSKLNPETFELINYSHYNVIDVTGNHLTVRFPNIQLADSTSNPQSSIGFIQYRIKPKSGWITDTIKNSAEIYFDYNSPIVTNTAKSYFVTPTAINKIEQNLDLNLYPNPTSSSVFINSQTNFNKIEVCNVTGQILLSEKFIGKTYQLQLQNLVKGIYFIKVIYNDGQSITKKVIKF